MIRVYVDETGDRGYSCRSSKFFAFAAVVVNDQADADMRAVLSTIRGTLTVPRMKPLHWKEHVKVFQRRQYVAGQLSRIKNLKVIYVIFEKSVVSAGLAQNQVKFYNYAAGLVLERALLSARHDFSGGDPVRVRFGHVRGFDHTETSSYFLLKRQQAPSWNPYTQLTREPTFDGQASWDGLQAADAYAGMLHAAINSDVYGGYEPQHLMSIRHQVRRGPQGQVDGFGWKTWAAPGTFSSLPWWPPGGL